MGGARGGERGWGGRTAAAAMDVGVEGEGEGAWAA